MADAAENVIDLTEMRKRLRPPPAPDSFVVSVMRTLANIDAVFAARKAPADG
jgi:hypothetical protein